MHRSLLRRASRVAICVVLIAFLAPAVRAGVYSFNDSFAFPLSPNSQVINLSQYDASLHPGEVLDHVELSIDGTVSADVTAENDSAISGNMSVNLTGIISGTGPSGTHPTVAILQSAGPVPVAASDGNTGSGPDFHDFGNISGSSSNSYTTYSTGLYLGSGTFAYTIDGNGGFSVSGVTDSTLHVNNFGASGMATVTYYTVAVPEPSTIALALFGACGMAVSLWRKRRTK